MHELFPAWSSVGSCFSEAGLRRSLATTARALNISTIDIIIQLHDGSSVDKSTGLKAPGGWSFA
jgi:hypothetical protein